MSTEDQYLKGMDIISKKCPEYAVAYFALMCWLSKDNELEGARAVQSTGSKDLKSGGGSEDTEYNVMRVIAGQPVDHCPWCEKGIAIEPWPHSKHDELSGRND